MALGSYTPSSDKIVHRTKVDFTKRNSIDQPVRLVQYDNRMPILAVSLFKDNEPYSVPSGYSVNIRVGKKGGKYVYNPALGASNSNQVVYFEITQAMVTDWGKIPVIVEIINGSALAGSSRITFDIDRNPAQEGDIESSSEGKALVDYVEQAKKDAASAEASKNAAAKSAQEAESAKQTVLDAVDDAEGYAADAQASKTAAAQSEKNAASANTQAQAAKDTAVQKATDASKSAEAAAGSAASAANDKQTVAENLQTVTELAEQVATNTATVESNTTKATESESKAKQYADAASTSANEAEASNVSAGEQATAAAASAEAAAGSAQYAAESQTEIENSMVTFEEYKTSAENSAKAAKQSENLASGYSVLAESSMNDAKTAADTATEKATAAEASNLSATAKAEEAASSAASAKASEDIAISKATEASESAAAAADSASSVSADKAEVEKNLQTVQSLAEQVSSDAQTVADNTAKTTESEANAKSYADAAKASQTEVESHLNEAETLVTEASGYVDASKNSAYAAAQSASDAAESLEAVKTYETNGEKWAKAAQSYAVGDTDYREGEAKDNAKYYYEQARTAVNSLTGALKPKGNISFEELLQLEEHVMGDYYNVTNEFTSTDIFTDGGDVHYPAGTDVFWTQDNKWNAVQGSGVSGVKGSSESNYRKGLVDIKPADLGLGKTLTVNHDGNSDTYNGTADVTVNIPATTVESLGLGKTLTITQNGKPSTYNGTEEVSVDIEIPEVTKETLGLGKTLTISQNGEDTTYDGSQDVSVSITIPEVTKESLGLENVDNTHDAEKNVASADKVNHALTITNGSNSVSFDGSVEKSIDIPVVTKESLGLENVDNTHDAEKDVASAEKVNHALTITSTDGSVEYDGSADVMVNIPVNDTQGINLLLGTKQNDNDSVGYRGSARAREKEGVFGIFEFRNENSYENSFPVLYDTNKKASIAGNTVETNLISGDYTFSLDCKATDEMMFPFSGVGLSVRKPDQKYNIYQFNTSCQINNEVEIPTDGKWHRINLHFHFDGFSGIEYENTNDLIVVAAPMISKDFPEETKFQTKKPKLEYGTVYDSEWSQCPDELVNDIDLAKAEKGEINLVKNSRVAKTSGLIQINNAPAVPKENGVIYEIEDGVLENGKTYTVSADITFISEKTTKKFSIEICNYTPDSIGEYYPPVSIMPDGSVDCIDGKLIGQVTITRDGGKKLFIATYPNSIQDVSFRVSNVKMQLGTIEKPMWTPAPQDILLKGEVDGRNLFVMGTATNGTYITSTGTEGKSSPINNERSSDYIPVKANEIISIHNIGTTNPTTTVVYWTALHWYTEEKIYIKTNFLQGGSNPQQIQHYDVSGTFTAPPDAAYLRVSARFYSDGKIKVERGATPTPWTPAPEDVVTGVNGVHGDVLIGGENLLVNSDFARGVNVGFGTSRGTSSIEEKDGLICVKFVASNDNGPHYLRFNVRTFPKWFKGSICGSVWVYTEDPSNLIAFFEERTIDNIGQQTGFNITGWNHVSFTGNVTGDNNDSVDFIIRILPNDSTSSGKTFWVYHPKVEVGNVPTDWSLGSGDLSNLVSEYYSKTNKKSAMAFEAYNDSGLVKAVLRADREGGNLRIIPPDDPGNESKYYEIDAYANTFLRLYSRGFQSSDIQILRLYANGRVFFPMALFMSRMVGNFWGHIDGENTSTAIVKGVVTVITFVNGLALLLFAGKCTENGTGDNISGPNLEKIKTLHEKNNKTTNFPNISAIQGGLFLSINTGGVIDTSLFDFGEDFMSYAAGWGPRRAHAVTNNSNNIDGIRSDMWLDKSIKKDNQYIGICLGKVVSYND